jgi:hypothetical protein
MPADRSAEPRIVFQRQVRTRLVVIGGIRAQNAPQMPHTEDKNVVQAVVPQRSKLETVDSASSKLWGVPRVHGELRQRSSESANAATGDQDRGLIGHFSSPQVSASASRSRRIRECTSGGDGPRPRHRLVSKPKQSAEAICGLGPSALVAVRVNASEVQALHNRRIREAE